MCSSYIWITKISAENCRNWFEVLQIVQNIMAAEINMTSLIVKNIQPY